MADTLIYVRDVETGVLFPLKLVDNQDATYSLGGSGTASQVTSVAIKAKTDLIGASVGLAGEASAALAANAFKRQAGVKQVFQKHITSAANAGDVVVATITAQDCDILVITLRSNGATTANLTSAGIFGGAAKVITFISAVVAVLANIAAADQQCAPYNGAVTLAATKTIVMTLAGTGATAVDLTVTVEYEAAVDGGYLV